MFKRYIKIIIFILALVIGIYSAIVFLINSNSTDYVTLDNIFMSIAALLLGVGFLLHSKDIKQTNGNRSAIYKAVALFFIIVSSLTLIIGTLWMLQ